MTTNNHAPEVFDDVTEDANGHKWTQVCTAHKDSAPFRYVAPGPNGSVCGVKGCTADADLYADFDDGIPCL